MSRGKFCAPIDKRDSPAYNERYASRDVHRMMRFREGVQVTGTQPSAHWWAGKPIGFRSGKTEKIKNARRSDAVHATKTACAAFTI